MVTLIIPVFNKVELTQRCLQSVLENSRHVVSVIVVNNASTDSTPEVLIDFQSRFQQRGISFLVIHNPKNLGFGAACNEGIRLLATEYCAILNNDTWVMPDWDDALLVSLREKKVDLIGPFFDERAGEDSLKARADKFLKRNKFKYRKHFVPILMLFTRDAIERLKLSHGGIFDERFFVTCEDTDLLHRMKLLQMTYAQTSRCYIFHESMGTRSQKHLLPNDYEAEGIRLFIEKWGFDPFPKDHTFIERLKRRYRKYRSARGLF